MKTKKHARIICLLLCLALLLVSCGDNDNDTSSKAVESVESVVEPVSDALSKPESFEESSEEPSNDESSEEPSEPDYQVEMTEEMANTFLKFNREKETISEIIASLKEYGNTGDAKDYNYKNDYIAFGNLGGYTFCYISPGFGFSAVNFRIGQYVTPDYKYLFCDGATRYKSCVNLYLYRDNTFVTFEEVCDQGLIDPAEAYELMCAAGYSEFVKKLTEEEANWYKELAEKGYPKAD